MWTFGAVVKIPLGMPPSHKGVSEVQELMIQVLGSLLPQVRPVLCSWLWPGPPSDVTGILGVN